MNGFGGNNWSKFKNGNIQGNSDEEDVVGETYDKQDETPKENNIGRHKTFILELVFVNRVIRTNTDDMVSKLLSFDKHPREEKSYTST